MLTAIKGVEIYVFYKTSLNNLLIYSLLPLYYRCLKGRAFKSTENDSLYLLPLYYLYKNYSFYCYCYIVIFIVICC